MCTSLYKYEYLVEWYTKKKSNIFIELRMNFIYVITELNTLCGDLFIVDNIFINNNKSAKI